MIKLNMTIKVKGALLDGTFLNRMSKVCQKSTEQISKRVEKEAQKDFLSKKIARPKMPSKIVDSFTYTEFKKGVVNYVGIVEAGGPTSEAYYAVYVDQDRPLANGKMWSEVNPKAPYEFMKNGLYNTKPIAKQIAGLNIIKYLKVI